MPCSGFSGRWPSTSVTLGHLPWNGLSRFHTFCSAVIQSAGHPRSAAAVAWSGRPFSSSEPSRASTRPSF
jgi:hypothetical protein